MMLNFSVKKDKKNLYPFKEIKKLNNLSLLTLDQFIESYELEISEYIDTFSKKKIKGIFHEKLDDDKIIDKIIARELSLNCLYFSDKFPKGDYNVSDDYIYEILVDYFNGNIDNNSIVLAVDTSKRDSYITPELKKLGKSSKKKRKRLEKRYGYNNPFNRIHGFFISKLNPCKCLPDKTKKVISLNVICAKPYSSKAGIKAVGTLLLCFFIILYKRANFDYAILEVANDSAVMPDYEVQEDYDREDLVALTIAEIKGILNEYGLSSSGKKDILVDRIMEYQDLENSKLCSLSYEERLKKQEDVECNDLDEYSYNGINYYIGKEEQKDLYCKFYEKIGFRENSLVHTNWNCFSNIPYPSMIMELKKYSYECIVDSFLERKWTDKSSSFCGDIDNKPSTCI